VNKRVFDREIYVQRCKQNNERQGCWLGTALSPKPDRPDAPQTGITVETVIDQSLAPESNSPTTEHKKLSDNPLRTHINLSRALESSKLSNSSAQQLQTDQSLTPQSYSFTPECSISTSRSKHYRTYNLASARGTAPESRAMMIPNLLQTKPFPAQTVARVHQQGKGLRKLELPPLSIPLPSSPKALRQQFEPLDLSDIRIARATSFLQFCRSPRAIAMRGT
jgi:hypothetical protein